MQQYVRDHAVLPLQRMEAQAPAELVGSSGTIQSLAEMAVAMARETGGKTVDTPERLSLEGLKRVVKALCERNEEGRMALPGMNPRRTGILIPGAAILQTIMEELNFSAVRVSGRGLRDGALADYVESMFEDKGRISVRGQSVLRLARLCRFEEVHSHHVANLAVMLFDHARALGLYRGPARMRELLYYAGLLHDIGIFLSFTRHNAHSHYLIQNSEMLGFTQKEVSFMAALALFHRYGYTKKDRAGVELSEEGLEEIRPLALFLSLAEALDISHRQAVTKAFFERREEGVALIVQAKAPCPVEQERLKRCFKAMEKCFGKTQVLWEMEG